MKRVLAILALPLLASAAPPPVAARPAEVAVTVTGLRSAKGQVLACLTARASGFPDCGKDPSAHRLAVPARPGAVVRFAGVAPGTYAVSLLHDENGNGKADMALFMPREGFGFSRDAPVRMGPPRFADAAFAVGADEVALTIKMRYLF